mmetsp:Transcript_45243/g.144979  ORF Transcript_45243/g.144979 Transcript_45243/m.144979 type:complete len:276 (-) Transcript_45243:126-953(-)
MFGLTVVQGGLVEVNTESVEGAKHDQLQLRVTGACSGEVLLNCTSVPKHWTVRRLKLAADVLHSQGSDAHFVHGDRLLDDVERLVDVAAGGKDGDADILNLMLVRTPTLAPSPPFGSYTDRTAFAAFPRDSSSHAVRWIVDARILRSSERAHVSSPFELKLGDASGSFPFHLSVCAPCGKAFKKSQGRGHILVKSLIALPEHSEHFELFISMCRPGDVPGAMSSVHVAKKHDFAFAPVAKLPPREDLDFAACVDPSSGTFEIIAEIVHVQDNGDI